VVRVEPHGLVKLLLRLRRQRSLSEEAALFGVAAMAFSSISAAFS
jgi:hypothetical protein